MDIPAENTYGEEKMYYAGIGSRETPIEIQKLFINVGRYLAKKKLILRSGGANGADQAFEKGCDLVSSKKEIYLPWAGFENSNSKLIVKDKKAFEIAEQFHPYWHNFIKVLRSYKQEIPSSTRTRLRDCFKIC